MYLSRQVFGHYKYRALDYYEVDNVNINTVYSHPAYVNISTVYSQHVHVFTLFIFLL
jgi:hypothetical protein